MYLIILSSTSVFSKSFKNDVAGILITLRKENKLNIKNDKLTITKKNNKIIQENTASKDIASADTALEDTASEDTASEDVVSEDADSKYEKKTYITEEWTGHVDKIFKYIIFGKK